MSSSSSGRDQEESQDSEAESSPAEARGAIRDFLRDPMGTDLFSTNGKGFPIGMVLFILNLIALIVVIALSLIFPGLF
ncbi:hypothetical protein [Salinibacter grassmerensis]|uniref:hypothetical protein n=1 Tax=Salinibacter grassmerensis TaxID=3040353 RepID=UPI0021E753AA|nr:hypothetical protein [Salinibacter grassmerensis]